LAGVFLILFEADNFLREKEKRSSLRNVLRKLTEYVLCVEGMEGNNFVACIFSRFCWFGR
jgi:hypothetical protein